MGCTYDVVSARFNNKDDAKKFLEAFNEILRDDFYDSDFDAIVGHIHKTDEYGREHIMMDVEPMFKLAEGCEIMEYFAVEFAKRYPEIKFHIFYECTYNNCPDAIIAEFDYDGDGIIKFKGTYGEDSGIYMCPECEAEFDEALVYLDDYNPNEKYFCPECGEEIEFDVSFEEREIVVNKED